MAQYPMSQQTLVREHGLRVSQGMVDDRGCQTLTIQPILQDDDGAKRLTLQNGRIRVDLKSD
jgi:hypothetical protein